MWRYKKQHPHRAPESGGGLFTTGRIVAVRWCDSYALGCLYGKREEVKRRRTFIGKDRSLRAKHVERLDFIGLAAHSLRNLS